MNYAECLHCDYRGSMILLSSIDKRMCPECKSYNVWRLKPNQPSVLIENKRGDHDETNETQVVHTR